MPVGWIRRAPRDGTCLNGLAPPRSIGVIVSTDYVGDGLMKLPFARAVRAAFPGAHVCWITTRGPTVYAGVLAETARPCIDEFLNVPQLADVSMVRLVCPLTFRRHFDLLIDTRGRWKQAAMARRVPSGMFLSPAARFLFSERRPPSRSAHVIERLLALVEAASGRQAAIDARVVPPEPARARAAAVLPAGDHYVGVAPGAGHPKKLWPLDRFVDVARQQAHVGRRPVFLLGPAELELAERLREQVPAALFPLQEAAYTGNGGPGVLDTIAIGERLAVAVANDSGAGHMLAASGRPLLSLFGPTSAAKLRSLAPQTAVLEAQDFGGEEDMTAIRVGTVVEALEALV